MRTVMIIPAVFRPSIFNKNIDYRGAREDFKAFLGSSLFNFIYKRNIKYLFLFHLKIFWENYK